MNSLQAAALLSLLALAACGRPPVDSETAAAPAPRETAKTSDGWFTEITVVSKLAFRHSAGAEAGYLMTEIMGSGAALFDYDLDGDLDVYLVDAGGEAGAETPNRLLRQETDGTFTDATAASGLGDPGFGMGVALGDVDNDGDLDVFVTNVGRDALYLNQGGGRFERAPGAVGDPGWSTSACFLDYDRDGALDLYVATYVDFDPPKSCSDRAGNPEFCGPEAFRGLPDRLFRGRGDGTFEDVSARALPGQPANKGLGVFCADFDRDTWVDVYVTNDAEPNQLWINRGPISAAAVTFEDRAPAMGAALNAFGKPEASMGVAAGDVDGDGDLDLFMTHLDRETNTLYLNLGDNGFEDRTGVSGLGPASLALTGFGTVLFDADLDGDLDLAAVDGRVRRGASPAERAARRAAWRVGAEVPAPLADYAEPNLFFLNDGGGRFTEAAALGQALTTTEAVEVGRALVVGDLDGDGDLLVQLGRISEAGAQYRRALALEPESTHALVGLARIALAAGDPAAAAQSLETAAALTPWHGEVHGLLAQAYRRLGRADDADLELLRAGAHQETTRAPDPILAAMEAEGAGSRAASERGRRLADDGHFAEAETEFRRVLEIRAATVRDLSNLGGALAGQGKFAAAIAEYEKALVLDPDDTVTLNNQGVALAGQGDLAGAVRRLRRALEIDPAYADAHRNLGLVLARQGRTAAAIAAYREALARNPSLAGAENDLGTALAGRGRIDEAMEHWRRALAIDSRELSALYNLSAALIQRGGHREAIDRLRRGMAAAPNSSRLATLLAWELASAPESELRDGAEAERLARRVHDAYPDQPQAADLLAAAVAAQGRFAEAVPLAERALVRAKALQQVDLAVQIAGRLGLYRRGEAFVQGTTR